VHILLLDRLIGESGSRVAGQRILLSRLFDPMDLALANDLLNMLTDISENLRRKRQTALCDLSAMEAWMTGGE